MSFVGGKLKLKGGVDIKSKKKKKHAKSSSIDHDAKKTGILETDADTPVDPAVIDTKEGDITTSKDKEEDRRTDAEKRHEAHMLRYEQERAKKAALKSHRERIKEMNEKLATLTEHHDIPRISYSYM